MLRILTADEIPHTGTFSGALAYINLNDRAGQSGSAERLRILRRMRSSPNATVPTGIAARILDAVF